MLPPSYSGDVELISSRPSYATVDNQDAKMLYLYHSISGSRGDNKADGLGRWVLNDVLGNSETALSFHNSWAVLPTLSTALADNRPNLYWKVHNGESWIPDEKARVVCQNGLDNVIYFSVEGLSWRIAGFYVYRQSFQGIPTYWHIGGEDDEQLFLYKLQNKWIVGHEVGSINGLAYTVSPHVVDARELNGTKWLFVTDGDPLWQYFEVNIVTGDISHDIYTKLRNHRSLKTVEDAYPLRNKIRIPAVGLGTGGIAWDKTSFAINTAIEIGYRLFDTAREYGNEGLIGDVLSRTSELTRKDVFLVSKVWPTYLGYIPTCREIAESLALLKTSYIDMYLLHWPRCDHTISWMHCETTVDSSGNWKQSWNALERAYGEGRLASIGVSNFNVELLGEFWGFGTVRPHLIQNFAEIGKLDLSVRNWCAQNDAIYMPYAHQRNINFLPKDVKRTIQIIAARHNVTSHVVISRFFYQSGASIIPRSSQPKHMEENYQNVYKFELSEEDMYSLGWTPTDIVMRNEL